MSNEMSDAEYRKLIRHRANRRDGIRDTFRHRRMHNAGAEAWIGTAEAKPLPRAPSNSAPAALPRSCGAVTKDWRYYRRVGAVWTDLNNTPAGRIKATGLVTQQILESDVRGLERICAAVAGEQLQQQKRDDDRAKQARRQRADFLAQIAANREKQGDAGKPKETRRADAKVRPRTAHARTQLLAVRPDSPASRKALFNRVGCSDMRGLLLTDNGLAAHLSGLCDEFGVRLPTYDFMPPSPMLHGPAATTMRLPHDRPAAAPTRARPRTAPAAGRKPLPT
ncbi:hypothetical protein M885DRAFT_506672 [Pelagophyceae sp. CCMP2097]|nr:hypothetical protein M885DRAFT_506672 [Pelagophyceae sp. CCMP2097]